MESNDMEDICINALLPINSTVKCQVLFLEVRTLHN